MNKRITSLMLVFTLILTMLATAVPAFAAPEDACTFTVKADKTTANPGETITFTIYMEQVGVILGLEGTLKIPSGLTYVPNSGKTADGIKTTLGWDAFDWTEESLFLNGYGSEDYTDTNEIALMTFQCTVNNDAAAQDYSVTFDEALAANQLGDPKEVTVNPVTVTVTVPHTHVYDQTSTDAAHLKTPATCTAAAVYYKSCTCGENGTETFTSGSALGHDYTQKFEDAAHLKTAASNCTEHNIYWYDCSRCDSNAKNDPEASDKYFTSATTGSHSFTEKIEDAAHYVDGTGTDCRSVKKYYYDCAYCNQIGTTTWDSTTYGPHNYAATWSSDADGHWHECSLCHGKKDEAAHTPGAAATETTPQKCTECDYTITPALGHTHHMTLVDGNPATCTADGNKAYYVCSGCSKWFEDATGSVEITDHSRVVIGHLGHDFAPATCTTPKTCKRDGCDATEGIALGHDWKDATCTAPKTCQRDGCGATEGEPNGHTEGTDWKNDANYHWHICSVDGCGAVIESSKAAHTPDREAATETDPIKCTECGYIIEEQLAPRTPVTNIAATITAPALGATPDCDPVFTFTPADSVELDEITWYKIAIAHFTGTDEDVWDEMETDEAFTTGYYYSVDMYFNPNDGFKLTESTTGTVNGMPHDDTYGELYNGHSYAYLSGLFEPLEPEYTIDLPVSLIVKLTGDKKPAKETFKFEIYDLGCEDAEFEIVNDTVVVENPEFDENGVAFANGIIKIKVTGEDQLYKLTESFCVRMVKGSAKGWTYASEQWCIELFVMDDAVDYGIGVKEIVDGEISEEYANGMSYSVSYEAVTEPGTTEPETTEPGTTEPGTTVPETTVPGTTEPETTEPETTAPGKPADPKDPQTGDNGMMFIWIALFFVSVIGVAGTTFFGRKKKHSAK